MKHFKKILLSVIFTILVVCGVALSDYFPDVIVTSPNGMWTDTRAYSSLANAITAIGANVRDVYIVRDEAFATQTIPANINLHITALGSLSNTGQLTINTTQIFAPARQVFTGTGNIDFADGTILKSSWFQNIESAFALTNNDTVTLLMTKAYTVTASYSPGNNVLLKWESPGNVLTVNAGRVVGNLHLIEAGNYQIFGGSGDFDFLDGTRLKLDWFLNLRACLTWVEVERVTIIVTGTNTVDFSDTATRNEYFDFKSEQGRFNISVGITLAIYSPLNVSALHNQQIKDGLGTLAWTTGGGEIWPDWWEENTTPGTTDMGDAWQDCIDSAIAVTTGPKPIIRASGEYAYTGDIETRTTTDNTLEGLVIRGDSGAHRGDAAVIEGMTTLKNIGTGSFYFGRIDTVGFRPWMVGSILENIQFEGNTNVTTQGLYVAGNNCVIRNVHITGYTNASAVGLRRTGELNSYYDVSSTNNYDGGASEVGANASAANNANKYYNCVWNSNTRYGDNPVAEVGANYISCLWQTNGADGYRHTSASYGNAFFGGWFEGNNDTTAGYQFYYTGISSATRSDRLAVSDTVFGGGGASVSGHIYLANTTYAKIFPAWYNATNQFTNGGANIALRINQPNTVIGSEGAPYLEQTTRTVAGASYARFNVNDAELGFNSGEGFGGEISHYPGTHETGAAYVRNVSDKVVDASGNTNMFLITFDDNYGQGYFTLTYTGAGSTTTYVGIKVVRHIQLVNNVATITTIGADDLRGNAAPATVWTDNLDGTIQVTITNNNAATTRGHAVLEGWGGGADGAEERGFTFTVQ